MSSFSCMMGMVLMENWGSMCIVLCWTDTRGMSIERNHWVLGFVVMGTVRPATQRWHEVDSFVLYTGFCLFLNSLKFIFWTHEHENNKLFMIYQTSLVVAWSTECVCQLLFISWGVARVFRWMGIIMSKSIQMPTWRSFQTKASAAAV